MDNEFTNNEMIKRLKYLRKDVLKLNQVDFAKNIHISQPQYSLLEKSLRVLTDRTFNDICREYNVNPTWLRLGEGDLFKTSNFDFYSLTEKEQVFLVAYSNIPEKDRLAMFDFFESISHNISAVKNGGKIQPKS